MKLKEKITRAEYEEGEKTLPKGCDFLADVPFFAIKKYKNSQDKIRFRVEFTKKQAKELVEKADKYVNIQQENSRLMSENHLLQENIKELTVRYDKMVQTIIDRNEEILKIKGINPDKIAKSNTKLKDSTERLAAAGTILRSPPLQGGLPG